MLNNNAAVGTTAVTYKFKSPDLSELFEAYSPEQIHIALEGALNIIFAQPKGEIIAPPADGEEMELEQSEDEEQLDHETQIVGDVTFALFAHQQGLEAEAAGITEMVPVEDPENTPLYSALEQGFRAIVDKLSADITNDSINQDVITLYGEMEFYSRIELFTFYYDVNNGILSVTLSSVL